MRTQSLIDLNRTAGPALLPRKLLYAIFISVAFAAIACTSAAVEPGVTPSPVNSPGPTGTPVSSSPGVPTDAKPTPSLPGDSVTGVIPVPPERDLYELARRLTLQTKQPVARFASPAPDPLKLGDRLEWRVSRSSGTVTVSAEVYHVSENAYWVFEDGFQPDAGRLSQAANQFESEIWPNVTGSFGNVWTPGIDNDPRIVIFHGELRPGVAGYFSGIDEYPRLIQPDSNQRETIAISANLLTLGGTAYQGTLAHELQHAIHWAADPGEESWVNEGLAEIASGLAGIPPESITSFLRKPNTSLVQWEPEIFEASPNYGAAALFFEYISAHYGGVETLKAIIEHPEDGLNSVTAVLQERGYDKTAASLFSDWVVANFADDETGLFSHPERQARTPRFDTVSVPDTVTDSVRPFGTNYYVLEDAGSEVNIEFAGAPTGQVFPAQPRSGASCWWSNAGDSIDTTLTRTVDLSSVNSATFNFWAWYAIEENWDYAYIEVSTDDGSTWQVMPSALTSSANPNGTAFGPGITGLSGGWVKDSINLSRYAGEKILLRIEYITDDAIHDRGACFDDFSIPELDMTDSTDGPGGWTSEGFALIGGRLPVEYLVQVIHDTPGAEAQVQRITVGPDGIAKATVHGPGDGEQLVIAVSAVTQEVTGSLDYSLKFSTR